MFKLAASEAARGGGGIEIPSSEFVTNVRSLLALPHQQSMVRLKYNTSNFVGENVLFYYSHDGCSNDN